MPFGAQAAIPVAVLLFVIGRICFAKGYAGGAGARAFELFGIDPARVQ